MARILGSQVSGAQVLGRQTPPTEIGSDWIVRPFIPPADLQLKPEESVEGNPQGIDEIAVSRYLLT
jgi:hypothetical protein